jgi:hypothetical protein
MVADTIASGIAAGAIAEPDLEGNKHARRRSTPHAHCSPHVTSEMRARPTR